FLAKGVPFGNLVEHGGAVLDERIADDDSPGLVGIDAFQQAHRARVVGEWTAHHERPVRDERVDELRVGVPAGLLTDAAARPRRAGSPDDDNSRWHGVSLRMRRYLVDLLQ